MSHGVTPYRVLVIDDNPAIHDDFKKVLAGSVATPVVDDLESMLFGDTACQVTPTYEVDTASQGTEGLAKILAAVEQNRPYAMVYTDMRMPPGWDGVQTLREIWKVVPGQQAAICTAYSDYSPEQIAGELGVRGKMVIVRKPFEPMEVRHLTDMVCEKWELSRRRGDLEREIQDRTADLKRAALHDGLTGLPNRLLLSDRLNQALLRSKRDPSYKFAVMFVDCDNFKTVNDTLGHQAGDSLLKQIAQRLQRVLGGMDTIARDGHAGDSLAARVGGDEFALLLSGISADADAALIAERLLEASAEPYTLAGQRVRSGMSLGVTTNSIIYATAEDMIRDADTAMYQAKHGGRNRYVLFDQALHDAAVKRLAIETELRSAVESGLIRPYFQPIIATSTCNLVGFEALARWHHPHRGLVMPQDFIPLAEETGVIIPLGMRILEDACRQLVAWAGQFPGAAALTMSVNVSRKQLGYPNLVEEVAQVVRRTGIDPRLLKLELTESSVVADSARAVSVLTQLREMNIQLQMDDFGTGYSSLSQLQSLPVDGIKLDGGFLNESNASHDGNPVLSAIHALAQGLRLSVVAECVETDAQFQRLKSVGCDFAQGFLFAPPLDPTAATAFVASVTTHAARAA